MWQLPDLTFFYKNMPVFKQNDVFAGRYVLSQLIGEGGFSEVWKALDQMADDAVVALKIYAPEKGLDDYGVRQFRKEFSLTHHLSHPHLMKVNYFDISEGSPYLIMPFCPFGSLSRILAEEGPFNEMKVAQVMCQIGAALAVLHSQELPILHQDIKPDNILMLNKETFLLADFGISSQIRHTLRKATSTNMSLTVAYAPPERFDRLPTSDKSSDIFSFGVTLYEVCTNRIPWDGSGGQSLLKGARVPSLPDSYSAELSNLLQACMSVERKNRPAAAELHLRARNYLETGQWKMPQKKKDSRKSFKRSLVPYLAAVTVFFIVLVGFGMYSGFIPKKGWDASAKTETLLAQEKELSRQLQDRIKILEEQLLKANHRIRYLDSVSTFSAKVSTDKPQKKEPVVLKKQSPAAENSPKVSKVKTIEIPVQAEENSLALAENLQDFLNRISSPKFSKSVRLGWKQEMIRQFADASVILNENSGAKEGFSANNFLILLVNVPHQIEVKEVKRDKNSKITELRLRMQSI